MPAEFKIVPTGRQKAQRSVRRKLKVKPVDAKMDAVKGQEHLAKMLQRVLKKTAGDHYKEVQE